MIHREGKDARGIVGRRIDWLSVAFRVRFPVASVENLRERAKYARKHGKAAIDFARELWQLTPAKGVAWWLESEVRGERLELAPSAPGQFVSGEGEVIPGYTLALHTSGVRLAIGRLSTALERSWRVARRSGLVFEGRVRRVDVTADMRGVLVEGLDERGWHPLPMVGVARELDDGTTVAEDRHGRSKRSSGVHRGDAERDERESGAVRLRGHDPQLTLLPGGRDDGVDLRPRR